jgi:hypothetical protein
VENTTGAPGERRVSEARLLPAHQNCSAPALKVGRGSVRSGAGPTITAGAPSQRRTDAILVLSACVCPGALAVIVGPGPEQIHTVAPTIVDVPLPWYVGSNLGTIP